MKKKSLLSIRRWSSPGRGGSAGKRHEFKPRGETLEGRALLAAATAVAPLAQYGVPSVFAIGNTGNVNYNFLTSERAPEFSGWNLVPGGVGARSLSTGTVLVSPILRPYVFLVNTADNIYYNSMNNSGSFNGWVPVGVNVGAVSIATGVVPLTNSPYVVMINGAYNIYFDSQMSNGAWAGWSPVGVNVGAVEVATGVIQTSLAPAVFEPYVVMMNTARNVYYTVRNLNGSWSNWSPVGVNVCAASISATTIANKPNVTLLNTAGNLYLNKQSSSGSWLGWSPVGVGSGSGATPAEASTTIISDYNNYVLAVNGSGQLNSAFGVFGSSSAWKPLEVLPAGVTATAISMTSAATTAPFAFVIGTDGNVYWADQPSWATWSTFASLGAPN